MPQWLAEDVHLLDSCESVRQCSSFPMSPPPLPLPFYLFPCPPLPIFPSSRSRFLYRHSVADSTWASSCFNIAFLPPVFDVLLLSEPKKVHDQGCQEEGPLMKYSIRRFACSSVSLATCTTRKAACTHTYLPRGPRGGDFTLDFYAYKSARPVPDS